MNNEKHERKFKFVLFYSNFYAFLIILPTAQETKNPAISAATTVAPTGVEADTEIRIPATEQITENTAEAITTDLKLLNIRIADSAGNIINAEIRSEPTRFIASTIITADETAIIILYNFVFIPAERAKSSSNVTANILL